MELPNLKQADKYVGLYIVDFGDSSGVGFTAQEVAELLESERYQHIKVYKIHRAYPDGWLELKGINSERFNLEAGMFFYWSEQESAKAGFEQLVKAAVSSAPPVRATVHLAEVDSDTFAVGLIYPAEYDNEISKWLTEINYFGAGALDVEGGVGAVQKYYDRRPIVIEKQQLFGQEKWESRSGAELLEGLKKAVQR